jgi:hypothetical protein
MDRNPPPEPARLPPPWSGRIIPVGTAPEQLPVLLERVLGTPARLRELLAGHSAEALRHSPAGRWCALAHLAHLLWVQQRMADRLEDFLALRPRLCDIDQSVQEAEAERQVLRDPGDLLEEFRLERLWAARAIAAAGPPVHRHVARHPCGDRPMRTADMLLWIAEHDDHHLAIMRHLLANR